MEKELREIFVQADIDWPSINFNRYASKKVVIKYGGSTVETEDGHKFLSDDLKFLRFLGIKPLIVHGGRPQIDAVLHQIGKKEVFEEGLRVTDLETIKIAKMVLSGGVNKDIVGYLCEAGINAVGLSGIDGNIALAKKYEKPVISDGHIIKTLDLGYVGEPDKLDSSLLNLLLEENYTPVLAPISRGENGAFYNVNADVFAGALAADLKAEFLLFLTDKPGVLDKAGSLIKQMSIQDAYSYIEDGTISGGMIPKVQTCICAIEKGVGAVAILNGQEPHAALLGLFRDSIVGTLITR